MNLVNLIKESKKIGMKVYGVVGKTDGYTAKNADIVAHPLEKGSTWHNPPMVPHQVLCLEAGSIIEVSTPDSEEDNYRVEKGDSQQI